MVPAGIADVPLYAKQPRTPATICAGVSAKETEEAPPLAEVPASLFAVAQPAAAATTNTPAVVFVEARGEPAKVIEAVDMYLPAVPALPIAAVVAVAAPTAFQATTAPVATVTPAFNLLKPAVTLAVTVFFAAAETVKPEFQDTRLPFTLELAKEPYLKVIDSTTAA